MRFADEREEQRYQVLLALEADRDRLRALNAELLEALERLGSSEAFKMPRCIDGDSDDELRARMDYARAAIAKARLAHTGE